MGQLLLMAAHLPGLVLRAFSGGAPLAAPGLELVLPDAAND